MERFLYEGERVGGRDAAAERTETPGFGAESDRTEKALTGTDGLRDPPVE